MHSHGFSRRCGYGLAVRAVALIFLLGVYCQVEAQDFGPIETRNLRSLSVPFLRIDPRTPVLGKGERSLSVGLQAANDMRRLGGGAVSEDYEIDRLLLRYRMGMSGGWDVTFDLPFLTRGGGILDPFIEAWHDIVLGGIPGNIRTDQPFGRSYVRVPGASFGSASGIGDVSMAATKAIDGRTMATVAVKLPTGNGRQILGSGNFDAGLAVQHRVPLGGRFDLYAQLGVIGQGEATDLPSARGLVHQEALALGWRATSRDHWVFQWQSEASATQTGVGGSDASHRLLSLAWQRRISSGQTLEVFFSEDGDWINYRAPELVNIGPDFTAGIRWVRRF